MFAAHNAQQAVTFRTQMGNSVSQVPSRSFIQLNEVSYYGTSCTGITSVAAAECWCYEETCDRWYRNSNFHSTEYFF